MSDWQISLWTDNTDKGGKEVEYPGYKRQPYDALVDYIRFPESSSDSGVAGFFVITDGSEIIYSGYITPIINLSSQVIPLLSIHVRD
jgi:hypothetical protein